MKATCLLFLVLILTMSCAASMRGTNYAVPSQRTSSKNHTRSRASLTGASRPQQLPNDRKHSVSGNATNLRQSGADKSGSDAKSRVIRNEALNSPLPVRPPSVVRPTVASLNNALNPSLNNVRNRGPNPAVVGGAANSYSGSTGAINGTRMTRRP